VAPINSTTVATDFLVGLAGMVYDPATGLYYDGARWYSPSTGKFESADPTGMAGSGTNLEAYCGNSPVENEDPSGECASGPSSYSLGIALAAPSPSPSPMPSLSPDLPDGMQSSMDYLLAYFRAQNNNNVDTFDVGGGTYNTKGTQTAEQFFAPVVDAVQPVVQPVIDAAVRVDQFGGQLNALAWGQGWVDPQYASGAVVLGNSLYASGRAGVRGVIATGNGVVQIGCMGADLTNATVECVSGYQLYQGDLSQTCQALNSGQIGYGQYYGEFGANTATFGVYGEVKAGYQLATGKISLDQATDTLFSTAVMQYAGAKVMQAAGIGNTPLFGSEPPPVLDIFQETGTSPYTTGAGTPYLGSTSLGGYTGESLPQLSVSDFAPNGQYRVNVSNNGQTVAIGNAADAGLQSTPQWIQPEPGTVDLVIHGYPGRFVDAYPTPTAEIPSPVVADLLQGAGIPRGSVPLRLLTCGAGEAAENGTISAQTLANSWGNTVSGPNGMLYPNANGGLPITTVDWYLGIGGEPTPVTTGSGSFIPFRPQSLGVGQSK
jgi:RHS repeat-associated protein